MYNQIGMIDYIKRLNKDNDPIFIEMEKYAEECKVPIIEKESLSVLLQLLQLHQSNYILEIGTAIGYSALQIASSLPEAHVDSLEKDQARFNKALEFRKKSKLTNKTNFYLADALNKRSLFDNKKKYDVLFIDAAKGKNKDFFTSFAPLVKKKGLIITDNVFFKGMVAGNEDIPDRIRPMVDKIRDYNDWLTGLSEYQTRFLAVGDGLAVSQKITE